METAVQFSGRGPFVLGLIGATYAKAEKIGEAKKILVELEDLAQRTYVPAMSFPWIYAELGEIDKAFDWLEKAADVHEGLLGHFHIDPSNDLFRAHPRYPVLLHKMNLEP